MNVTKKLESIMDLAANYVAQIRIALMAGDYVRAMNTVNKLEGSIFEAICLIEKSEQINPDKAPQIHPESVVQYIESQLQSYIFWCDAGPAGQGWHSWHKYPSAKAGYEQIRDWLATQLEAMGKVGNVT